MGCFTVGRGGISLAKGIHVKKLGPILKQLIKTNNYKRCTTNTTIYYNIYSFGMPYIFKIENQVV
jgi:hypothetical protein